MSTNIKQNNTNSENNANLSNSGNQTKINKLAKENKFKITNNTLAQNYYTLPSGASKFENESYIKQLEIARQDEIIN